MGIEEQGFKSSSGRYRVIPRTLVFVTYEDKVLLLKSAPNKKIWPNKYNGIGGHIESGETIIEAALREVREEAGLPTVNNLHLCGTINIQTEDPSTGILLFVFSGESTTLAVTSSHEGSPEWVHWDTLPAEDLVEDIPHLLPRVLSDEQAIFHAVYRYNQNNQLVVEFYPSPAESQ